MPNNVVTPVGILTLSTNDEYRVQLPLFHIDVSPVF